MPIYEYECGRCGHSGSDLDSISAPRVKKCPECGRRSFKRLISAAAFHLKGGGWYATDFKDKPKSSGKAEESESSESSSASDNPDKAEKSANAANADKATNANNAKNATTKKDGNGKTDSAVTPADSKHAKSARKK